jgi:hypothetical protein
MIFAAAASTSSVLFVSLPGICVSLFCSFAVVLPTVLHNKQIGVNSLSLAYLQTIQCPRRSRPKSHLSSFGTPLWEKRCKSLWGSQKVLATMMTTAMLTTTEMTMILQCPPLLVQGFTSKRWNKGVKWISNSA